MAFFTIAELIDLIIMVAALGFIFSAYIKSPKTEYSTVYKKPGFNWEDFKFAALITAPGVVLHELAHKFVALFLGLTATFHASYFGLFLGVFLKMIAAPFIVFIPGFVSIAGPGITHFQSFLTAFAGPLMNLSLFLGAYIILNRKKNLTRNQAIILYLTKQINLFLFLFNMIPLPPFDGSKVFYSLYKMIF